MSLTEPSLNTILAEELEALMSDWRVTSESTNVIRGRTSLQPDIVVQVPGKLPVIIEHEYAPAYSIEQEAQSRLGLQLSDNGIEIDRVIALVSDASLKSSIGIASARAQLRQTSFEYALWSQKSRYPASGYVKGNLHDLVWFILNSGVPTEALKRSIATLEHYVVDAASVLKSKVAQNDHSVVKIATILNQDFPTATDQEDVLTQMMGMVATILINAVVFQQQLAENFDIRNLAQMESQKKLSQIGFIQEWDEILSINYWPIFNLARQLLDSIHSPTGALELIKIIKTYTEELMKLGIVNSEDLSGVVFQRFITDRKYLATFYTRPSAANLLACLAIPEWSNPSEYQNFSIADFACGTGTLIHAAYKRLSVLQQLAGGENPKSLHRRMMEHNLNAADIVPSAAQLTASMLSSVYPTEFYIHSRVVVPQYGKITDREVTSIDDVRLGSLELIDRLHSGVLPLYQTKELITSSGRAKENELIIRDRSQKLVIMNPPFTRAGSDWDRKGRHVKQFRGLGTSKQEQQLMAKREKHLFRNTCRHGYAGIGSSFMAVVDYMLRAGGRMAVVIPLSAAIGISWKKTRDLINSQYGDLIVASIADSSDRNRAFSADSDFPDLLVVARKGHSSTHTVFIVLDRCPDNNFESYEVAKILRDQEALSCLDDQVLTGGTKIKIGEQIVGSAIKVSRNDSRQWLAVGMRRLELAQITHHLSHGVLLLPRTTTDFEVPICSVKVVIDGISQNSMNIANSSTSPFKKREPCSEHAAYPMLWNHNKTRDIQLTIEPDSEGIPKTEEKSKVMKVWNARGHAHFSRSTRTTQVLTAAWTTEKTIGGRCWPVIQMKTVEMEAAFVVWSNTTLGVLLHWYFGNRSQVLLADHTVSSFPNTPTLNVKVLSTTQLKQAYEILDEFSEREMLPMNQMHQDSTRQELDRRVLVDLLQMPAELLEHLQLVRQWWCDEPTVKGRS
ncbi:MAG: hypothetical protein F4039_05320 [Gammaproteobacteria bacterium]|nr:hypothetical protein [Gammaproteobacteria bacterium]MXX95044.1 hypothetical protein [Gammaproteobacteria bacterium]MYF53199.1 hypothetical protein [Gammaproteobacteria bacterium]MYK43488.1 hypothetical protein [Gammaproteobacteria bacterium]